MSASAAAAGIRRTIDAVWRIESARLIAGLARIVRDVGVAEELAQDALVAALEQWPESGVPDNPGAWLMATAKHRAIDRLRRNERLQRKHEQIAHELAILQAAEPDLAAELDDDIGDDLLRLVFTTCHPLLSPEARVALTLRLLGGLTTAEIARAARAISAVVRPPSRRSVATRASGESSGWHVVKTSRRRSSPMSSSSSPSGSAAWCASSCAICSCLRSRRSLRRRTWRGAWRWPSARRPRVVRHARLGPLLERRHERVLGELLRHPDVPHDACEPGDQPCRLDPPDGVDRAADAGSGGGGADPLPYSPAVSRRGPLLLLAQARASARPRSPRARTRASARSPGAAVERGALQPFDRLVERAHLPDPEAGDPLLRLGEQPSRSRSTTRVQPLAESITPALTSSSL